MDLAPPNYEEDQESTFRRTVEQNFQDIATDIHSTKIQANENYIYYGKALAANDSVFVIIGITLQDGDVITVRSSAADEIAFSLFGVETS